MGFFLGLIGPQPGLLKYANLGFGWGPLLGFGLVGVNISIRPRPHSSGLGDGSIKALAQQPDLAV